MHTVCNERTGFTHLGQGREPFIPPFLHKTLKDILCNPHWSNASFALREAERIVIRHEGDKWILYSQDGSKVLGRHDTKEDAEAQERAIEANKKGSDGSLAAEKTLKDFLPIPILTMGKTKNEDMEITQEVFDDVLKTYDMSVHPAPMVKKPHEDWFAGFKEKGREGDALGWVKELGVKNYDGRDWIVITQAEAANPEYEAELVRMLSGPMKLNSPEAVPGEMLETELYGPEKTKNFPAGYKDKHFLRRVNFYGKDPVAQFHMPQATLADGDKFITINFKEFDMKSRLTLAEGATTPETPQQPTIVAEEKNCPSCGKAYAEGDKFCRECGTKLMAEPTAVAGEQPTTPETPAVPAVAANDGKPSEIRIRLSELERKDRERQRELENVKNENKDLKKDNAEARLRERRAEIKEEFEAMLKDGETLPYKLPGAIQLAELLETKDARVIKLSDEKTTSAVEMVMDLIRLPQPIVAAEQHLAVYGDRSKENPTKKSLIDKHKAIVLSEGQGLKGSKLLEEAKSRAQKEPAWVRAK